MSIPEQDVVAKFALNGVPKVFWIVLGAVRMPRPVALNDFVRGAPAYLSGFYGMATSIIFDTTNHFYPE